MDIVVAIYVLSAIEPEKFVQSIRNLASRLKPGGLLLYKDYGRFDLTQLRFKKNRLIDDNFCEFFRSSNFGCRFLHLVKSMFSLYRLRLIVLLRSRLFIQIVAAMER